MWLLAARACHVNPLAGKPAGHARPLNVRRLVTAYYTETPDPAVAEQQVSFGTAGHQGSPLNSTFNEAHVLSISQAICDYRKRQAVDGPVFLGIDTHALSMPTFATAIEVLAANSVEVVLAANDESTLTLAVSHAIRTYNRGRLAGLADGIVITPPHNRPEDGAFKYRVPHGGPADVDATRWVDTAANEYLRWGPASVRGLRCEQALAVLTTHFTRSPGLLPPNRSLYAAITMNCAKSFRDADPLRRLLEEAEEIINVAIGGPVTPPSAAPGTRKLGVSA
jgi:phosphoglucomutase